MIYIRLFWEFFKTGLFSIGGGLATLPFLNSLGLKTGWFTAQDVADMLAISESTPGPIGVNMATFVGFRCGGVPGGIIATLGLTTPSILVILLVAMALQKFRENKYVCAVMFGLRPASTALIASAGFSVCVLTLANIPLFRDSGRWIDIFRWPAILMAILLWILTNLIKPTKKLHPILFIAASAAAGILLRFGGA